jgi:integrase
MPYHVFRKPKILKGGKKVHRWYYYWIDAETGKSIQRACRGCKNRSEAENYIRSIPLPAGAVVPGGQKTIRDIAQNMYIPGSDHINRRIQLGKSVDPETMIECRRYIGKIIENWGDLPPGDLESSVIMAYLFGVRRSGKWKNRFLDVLGEVFKETPWYKCPTPKPILQRFANNSKKADIFSTEELDRLFRPENFISYQFYLFFLLCLSGGLRLGEVRGVRPKQLIFDRKILIVDGFCRGDGTRTNYNKKGSIDNPKFRLVFLPEMTLGKMQAWITDNALDPEDFCFTQDGRPIRRELAETVFYRALQTAGFVPVPEKAPRGARGDGRKKQDKTKARPLDGRKLVPHSLRYTYVSRMRRELSAKELLPMTGHTTEGMVDYYNRKALDLALAALPDSARAAADTLFT